MLAAAHTPAAGVKVAVHVRPPSPEWNHYRVTCNDGVIKLALFIGYLLLISRMDGTLAAFGSR